MHTCTYTVYTHFNLCTNLSQATCDICSVNIIMVIWDLSFPCPYHIRDWIWPNGAHSETLRIKFPSLPHNNTILPVSHTQKEEVMQLITFIKFHSQGFISLLRFKRNFPWLIFSYSNSYVGVKLHHLGILPNISKPTLNFQTI